MSKVDAKKEELTGIAAIEAELPGMLAELTSEEMLRKDLSEIEAWVAEYSKKIVKPIQKALHLQRQKAKEKQETS